MTTTVKVDNESRVVLRGAAPGQEVLIQRTPDGWTLTVVKENHRLVQVKSKTEPSMADIIKKLKPLTNEEARQAYEVPDPEFDALEHHCASLPVAVQKEQD